MTDNNFVHLDVRPILRAGGEPFEKIMETVTALSPDQNLRLLATFKPTPLFHVLASQGFEHEDRELAGGEWEILFRRTGIAPPAPQPTMSATDSTDEWAEPVEAMDHRDLDPPEPMVRILASLEAAQEGQVISALLCREPIFLLPELAKRGHSWRGGFEPDGSTYKILIRAGGRSGTA
jgi:uncharacterized protein (DUF2249 family)